MDESVKFINSTNEAKSPIIGNSLNNFGKISPNKTIKMIYLFKFINFSLFFFFYFYRISAIDSQSINFHNSNLNEEIDIMENFYKFSENGILFNGMREKRRKNPFLSIIIPVFNNEKNIKRIITSIENQSYKNIEMIFVDDASSDNSIKEIEIYKKKDKRIKIIKHKKKKGLFITRNDGVINSKGEYIIFIEGNGLLNDGILKKIFGAIEMYETDIIKFDSFYFDNNIFEKYDLDDNIKKYKIIYQPQILRLSFSPYRGELFQNYLYLWGKAIKRTLYLKIIDKLSTYYKNQNWNLYEDTALDFLLLKHAESFIFIKENGYLYEKNEENNSEKDIKNQANDIIKDLFILAEFFYDYTEDNIYEKLMAIFQLKRIIYDYNNYLALIDKHFEKYHEILNKFSYCNNFLPSQKLYIEQARQLLIKVENN